MDEEIEQLENLSKPELEALGVKLTKRGKIDKRAFISKEKNIKKALEARKEMDTHKLNQKYEEDFEDIFIEEDLPPQKPIVKRELKQQDYLVEVKNPSIKNNKKAPPPRRDEDEDDYESPPRRRNRNRDDDELNRIKQELLELKLKQADASVKASAEKINNQTRKLKYIEQIIPLFD
jgi:hypothetical protein